MKLRTFISVLVMFTMIPVWSQSLIGMDKDEVKLAIKKDFKYLNPDRTIVKQHYNYLKYINRAGTITFIIYFSENDIATSTKKVCDYAEYDFVLDDLNEKYRKTGEKKWEYEEGNKSYLIELIETEWYFTVQIKEKEKGKEKIKRKSLFKKK